MRGHTFTSALLRQLTPKGAPARATARREADAERARPMHDPLLEPRDEAVFLLTAAAEIEHALMVQYLYAGYSVRVAGDSVKKLAEIQNLLFQVAREEMGHLATVQNLLHLIGGPLSFNREHSPYASEIYPFRFKLEPLSLDSLAKYVVAESPEELPDNFPKADEDLVVQLVEDAKRSNDGRPVSHVGPIFARLQQLFDGGDDGLGDEDFRLDRHPLQARFEDWGFEPRSPALGEPLIIESFGAGDVAQVRSRAVVAIDKIGAQGEGFDLPEGPGQSESHFERFLDIHRRFRELADADVRGTWPVTENPNTTEAPREPANLTGMVDLVQEAYAARGRITHPRTLAWAHLFNLRYRLLLGCLSHFLRLRQELYVPGPGPRQGDRTARGLLLIWTFTEMRRLKKIAGKLVQLPRVDPPDGANAGPPFELPYTLNLPDGEEDRWRMHLDVSRASVRLVRERLQPGDAGDGGDGFLEDLVALDEKAQAIMRSLAAGTGVPPGSLPTDFQKAVLILEEAVRGFDLPPEAMRHKHFWADKRRDQFVATDIPPKILARTPEDELDFNPNRSVLVNLLKGPLPGLPRMPRFRPPVPPERIAFLRDWIARGCPDNDPPGEVGLQRERDPAPEPVVEPATAGTQTPGFAADIRPLFRDSPDRDSMLAIADFDLHSLEDVREHAGNILARLEDGTMPCDANWPAERIALFRNWIRGGKRP